MPESLLPCAARSSNTIGGPSQFSLEVGPSQDRVTIDTLPDDVLLQIFRFYLNRWENEWHTLVHVCQRWRSIVFASPRHLNLQIEYSGKRPLSEMLDVWPVLPVAIDYSRNSSWRYLKNVAGALESEHHRICQITLPPIPTSQWERFSAAMQKPFPVLTYLWFGVKWFGVEDNTVTPLSDSFLGGSTPLLQELSLNNCPFQGLPKLLLSANQLVSLNLSKIPRSGHISPQDLGTALSVMSRLKTLLLGFRSPLYPERRPPPPLTRSVLPALTDLEFKGVYGYLEDLLAQIELPFLDSLRITFYMDIDFVFVLPQLHRLISHSKYFKTCDRATVRSFDLGSLIKIFRGTYPFLSLAIWPIEFEGWSLAFASLAQICSSTFPLSNLIQLEIVDLDHSLWAIGIETTQWLEILDPFIAVKDLRLSSKVAPHLCRALVELAEERQTDVLPALQNIFLEGLKPLESVSKYIAARTLSGHPVAVHRLEGPTQDGRDG